MHDVVKRTIAIMLATDNIIRAVPRKFADGESARVKNLLMVLYVKSFRPDKMGRERA